MRHESAFDEGNSSKCVQCALTCLLAAIAFLNGTAVILCALDWNVEGMIVCSILFACAIERFRALLVYISSLAT